MSIQVSCAYCPFMHWRKDLNVVNGIIPEPIRNSILYQFQNELQDIFGIFFVDEEKIIQLSIGRLKGRNNALWRELGSLCWFHKIEWQWVKGHNGHIENERPEQLARNEIARMCR